MNATDSLELTSSRETNEDCTFRCFICGKEFSKEKQYFGHLRIHSGDVLWCCDKYPQVDTVLVSQSRLKTHENFSHTLVKPYKCSICNNIFDRASQLDYHNRSIHLGEKSQVCQICGKGFFRKTDLRTHLNVHLGTNQSICEICGRKFNHISNLIRHSRTHIGSKPYPCTICRKRFTQISSLARHKQIHSRNLSTYFNKNQDNHLSGNKESPQIGEKRIAKRQHYCRVCGESFQFIIELRQHRRLHSKVLNNRCDKNNIKNQQQGPSSRNDNQVTGQREHMVLSNKASQQLEITNWENVQPVSANVPNNIEEVAKKEPNNYIQNHLLELNCKMHATEIESDRNVSISISDILSPYNCNEMELSSADILEPKLDDNQSSSNKRNDMGKECDIVQCLDSVDFVSNANQIFSQLGESPGKTSIKCNNIRLKSICKDIKSCKAVKSASSLPRDQYSKCLHVEGSQLYIEICETEQLKSSNLQTLELQEVENVAFFQEVFGPSQDNEAETLKLHAQKTSAIKSAKSVRNINSRVDNAEGLTGSEEPTLRLVQTEMGEQFYELVINKQYTDNSDHLKAGEDVEDRSTQQTDTEHDLSMPICLNNSQTVSKDPHVIELEKLSNVSNCNEFFTLLPNTETYKDSNTSQSNTSSPMVRLVQNEDGEQFFELIREPSEYEKSREDGTIENPCDEGKFDIESTMDNPKCEHESKTTVNTCSAVKTYKKDVIVQNIHQATDRLRKFQCTECNKWFSTAYNFKQHAGTHFSDQQKFKCKECGLSFAWKSTLNKHLACNHRPDGPQKFVCEICPKVYSTLSQVNEHVKRDHLKERNHVCSHCGKSFFKKFDLKTHSRTHTNDRPYVCRACGKRFHHQSHIIRHERIHSGERPYVCNICQRTFTQQSSLKKHKQRHRDVKIDILEYRMNEDDPLSLTVQ